jgi:prevent-host-death family protein
MGTVGIKVLKERLSEYVALARGGERIIVTDRGEEVAELVPLSPERQALKCLQRAGRVRWSGSKPVGLRGVPVHGADVASAVVEDRG